MPFELFAAHVSRALFASCAPSRGAATRELPVAPVCGVCEEGVRELANSTDSEEYRDRLSVRGAKY